MGRVGFTSAGRGGSRRALLLLVMAISFPGCSSPDDVAGDARKAALAAVASQNWSAAHSAILALRAARPETPKILAEVAGLMVQAGEADEAIWLLEDAIARFPSSDALRVELARGALRLGRPGRAVMALEGIAADSPLGAEALSLAAQGWLGIGDAGQARSHLESAEWGLGSEAHPTLEGELELIRLGLAALEGEGDDGLSALRARSESDGHNAAAWRVLARQLRREDRSEEARTLVEAAFDADPDNIDLVSLLVEIYRALEDDLAAERILRERIDRHPSSGAHYALAQLRIAQGDLDGASGRYVLAIERFPKSAMLRSGHIEVMIERGRVDAAEAEFSKYSRVREGAARGELLRARFELAGDRPEHALRRLSELVTTLDTPSTQYWLGRALEATDDLAAAEKHYQVAHRGNRTDVFAAIAVARLARQRGDWRATIRAAQSAVESGPHEPRGWKLLAEAFGELGEWGRAEELARRRLELFPNRVDSHVRLAEALRSTKQLDEALAVLQGAEKVGVLKGPLLAGRRRAAQQRRAVNPAEKNAQAPEIMAERALLLATRGKLAEGLELTTRILDSEQKRAKLSPAQEARLLTVKASLLFGQGRESEAASTSRLALAIDSEDLRPLRLRAAHYVRAKRADMARRDCETYLEMRPDDPRILLLYGMVLVELGNDDEAVAPYRRAMELNEPDWVAANNLAMILVERGEFDEALVAATRAYSLASDNVFVLDTMGFVAQQAGHAERAIEVLERAQKLNPKFLDPQLHLAQAYAAGGRATDARRLLQKLESLAARNRVALARIEEVRAALR